ncbi:hypothetical protein ZOSMA_5G01170 [Zostera marina]|uniref:Uncharacterized protein n=1 Tax=Zostera marina TaxID=29655 RepID=A0A0K9NW29_ZOSMR|nr:hypothetical protein ZOSMA_5G01170 [Zostera marina]
MKIKSGGKMKRRRSASERIGVTNGDTGTVFNGWILDYDFILVLSRARSMENMILMNPNMGENAATKKKRGDVVCKGNIMTAYCDVLCNVNKDD